MEIARAAAALFVRQGLRATRAEDIAQAAGIAPRTFYRYFASKEEAVAPLYAAGAELCIQAVRDAPAGLSLPEAIRHAVEHTLSPDTRVSAASWEWVRTLIRLADASPALGKVWAEVCRTSEYALAETLAERLSRAGATGTTWATGAMGATGVAEAADPVGAAGSADAAEPAGAAGSAGSLGSAGAVRSAGDNVARPAAIPPRLRLTAAVAGAAIRVAVESWAATTSAPTGPDGPAALALRNLTALQNYAWPGNPA
ncbi:TetR/AcrR family transcriptional regulator [Streptomyces sp. 1-11]|uniref:TetR/AcrR family transcriptional regulator n=1 Tax=Streptomyces sp. 1-11 TaxID=2590549 RepID=UPI001180CC06|nr:TetR family transcriptional regulator [Streptomyces sp. 1-11]